MRISRLRLHLFALALVPATVMAQGTGGEGVPPLDVENVTIVGTRVIRLPAARKGEVVDSSRYILPAGDSLMFGDRVSSFGGPGGVLPGYRELDPPATANLEASLGTYLSPQARVHGEYVQRPFDAMGTFEYAASAGHTDSAEATSLLLELGGGVVLGGEDPTAPRVRIGAWFDLGNDGYTLFGSRAAPYDRSRSALRFNGRVNSAQDGLVDYDLAFRLESTTVEDRLGDSVRDVSASTPGFGLGLAVGDDTLRARAMVDYQITTLRYDSSQTTPNFVAVAGVVEWRPSPALSLEGGLSYYGGQFTDSGSATLLAPRVAARYAAAPGLTLYARFTPEMRAASYRSMMMQAPYVAREMELRPERVPVSLAAGARLTFGETNGGSVDAHVAYESASNTPVVAVGADRGALRWAYVDSRTVTLAASGRYQIDERFDVGSELAIRSAVDAETDEPLPMVAPVELTLSGRYAVTPALAFEARASWLGERRAALGSDPASTGRTVDGRLLLDVTGTIRIAPRFELFAGVTNLLAQQYQWWDGYEAPGLELRAGARLSF